MKATRILSLAFCLHLMAVLSACGGGGGMSEAQVKQSLVAFFGEIDQAYSDAGGPPLEDPTKFLEWTIELDSKQLAIVDNYLAANTYPAKVQQHLTDMRDGLAERNLTHQAWLDAGKTRDTAATDEQRSVDDAAMKATSAETQLRIATGL